MSEEHEHREHLSERLKEVPGFLKQQFGTVDQEPPNKPSFLLIVVLFGATIIVIFIIAIFVLHLGGASWTRHSFHKHPTSQLMMPAVAAPSTTSWSA